MHTSIKLALATGAVASFGLVGVPAANAAQHCASQDGKVEVDAGPDLFVGLPAGTQVCIKTGTKAYTVTVDANGFIHSTVLNKPGNAYLGISYYVPGGGPSS